MEQMKASKQEISLAQLTSSRNLSGLVKLTIRNLGYTRNLPGRGRTVGFYSEFEFGYYLLNDDSNSETESFLIATK